MDVDYAILADGVSNRADGKIDIFGAGFDTIFASAVPARHAQLSIAVRLLIDRHELEDEHRLRVLLLDADGSELQRMEAQLDAASVEQRAAIPAGRRAGFTLVFNMAGVLFPRFGDYHFAFYWDGTQARDPILLSVAQIPVSPQ